MPGRWGAIVSVDVGQRSDYTALCVVAPLLWCGPPEVVPTGRWGVEVDPREAIARNRPGAVPGWLNPADLLEWELEGLRHRQDDAPSRPPLAVVHLDRVRGLNYVAVVQRVKELVRSLPAHLETKLLVDVGGVGCGVGDLMRSEGLEPAFITATGGTNVGGRWGDVTVPKRDLVATTQVLLGNGRLRVVSSLPLAKVLIDKMVNYQVRIDPRTAHDSYSAREGEHDDLVFCLAQAVWGHEWFWRHWLEQDDYYRRPPAA